MFRRRSTGSVTVVAATVVAVVASLALAACQPPKPAAYIALGDSYTAGPLIPDQSLDPLGCLRSNHDWPHLVAGKVHASTFTDVSCSGADTKDMRNEQGVTPGPNPPQLDVVDATTKIVTLQIGGNDIGFSSIVKNCATENPFGSGCKPDYVADGHDLLAEKIAATAPKVDAVLAEIHRRAPQAAVFVVGYPTILPETGSGCYPWVPLLPSDVPYLRSTAKRLNAMLADRAAAAGDVYVDIATPSIGHDMCASDHWVEAIVPTSAAAPVHPNATGMRHSADVVAAVINAHVPS